MQNHRASCELEAKSAAEAVVSLTLSFLHMLASLRYFYPLTSYQKTFSSFTLQVGLVLTSIWIYEGAFCVCALACACELLLRL